MLIKFIKWKWISISWLRDVYLILMQGTWCCNTYLVLDHYTVHPLANGWNAWNGSWETIWSLPWIRPICIRWKAWPLYCGTPAVDRWGRCGYSIYGHGRKISTEVPSNRMSWLQGYQTHIFHHDLRFCSFCTIPPPKLQLYLWGIFGSCSHVFDVNLISFYINFHYDHL